MSVIINEIQLASELSHKVTVDYILSDKELFLHYDTEDDLLVDDNGVLIYQDDVQEVFNAYYDYFISKILECAEPEWIETDTDSNQWGRKMGDGIYEFKEDRVCNPDTESRETYHSTIFLRNYSEEEKLSAVKSFGYASLEVLESIYGDHAEWVLAECLFELEY